MSPLALLVPALRAGLYLVAYVFVQLAVARWLVYPAFSPAGPPRPGSFGGSVELALLAVLATIPPQILITWLFARGLARRREGRPAAARRRGARRPRRPRRLAGARPPPAGPRGGGPLRRPQPGAGARPRLVAPAAARAARPDAPRLPAPGGARGVGDARLRLPDAARALAGLGRGARLRAPLRPPPPGESRLLLAGARQHRARRPAPRRAGRAHRQPVEPVDRPRGLEL